MAKHTGMEKTAAELRAEAEAVKAEIALARERLDVAAIVGLRARLDAIPLELDAAEMRAKVTRIHDIEARIPELEAELQKATSHLRACGQALAEAQKREGEAAAVRANLFQRLRTLQTDAATMRRSVGALKTPQGPVVRSTWQGE